MRLYFFGQLLFNFSTGELLLRHQKYYISMTLFARIDVKSDVRCNILIEIHN